MLVVSKSPLPLAMKIFAFESAATPAPDIQNPAFPSPSGVVRNTAFCVSVVASYANNQPW